VSIITKLLRWLRRPAGPEDEAEAESLRAERESVRAAQHALMGPRGVPGTRLPSTRDDPTDPRS